MHRPTTAALLLILGISALSAAEPAKGPTIRLNLPEGGKATIDVSGVDGAILQKLTGEELSAERWSEILFVHIGDPKSDRSQLVPLRGSYRVEAGVIRFEPRYSLVAGTRYRAIFNPAKLPGQTTGEAVVAELSLPRPDLPPALVEHVYPSAGTLPENQLRFYIHFSVPMSQGQAYEHIKLLNESGKVVEGPFLELREELWEPTGKRFTLLIDPGRIKRGLKPREELGPVLEQGKSYTLVIDAKWPDAQGNLLKQEYRKTFRAAAPVEEGIEPKTWKVQPPVASGTNPLSVTFPRPLDNALLRRAISVTDPKGATLEGQVTVGDDEKRWQFTPAKPWETGEYNLVIDTTLEDLAGNRVGRPFEVDVFHPIEKEIQRKTVNLPFRIGPSK